MQFERLTEVNNTLRTSHERSKNQSVDQYRDYSYGDRQEASAPSPHGETDKGKQQGSQADPAASKQILRELLNSLNQEELLRLQALSRDATKASVPREVNLTSQYGPGFHGALAGTQKMAISFRDHCLTPEQRKDYNAYHAISICKHAKDCTQEYREEATIKHTSLQNSPGHIYCKIYDNIRKHCSDRNRIRDYINTNYPNMLEQVQNWLNQGYPKAGKGTSSQQPEQDPSASKGSEGEGTSSQQPKTCERSTTGQIRLTHEAMQYYPGTYEERREKYYNS